MKERILKEGQKRTIYRDPFTEKMAEGKVVLIKKVSDSVRSEYWRVRFISDNFICDRKIRTD